MPISPSEIRNAGTDTRFLEKVFEDIDFQLKNFGYIFQEYSTIDIKLRFSRWYLSSFIFDAIKRHYEAAGWQVLKESTDIPGTDGYHVVRFRERVSTEEFVNRERLRLQKANKTIKKKLKSR